MLCSFLKSFKILEILEIFSLPAKNNDAPPVTDASMCRVLMERETRDFLEKVLVPRLASLPPSAHVCAVLQKLQSRSSVPVSDAVIDDAVTKFLLEGCYSGVSEIGGEDRRVGEVTRKTVETALGKSAGTWFAENLADRTAQMSE